MNFDFSDKVKDYQLQLQRFMNEHVFPNESLYEEQWTARRPFFRSATNHGRTEEEDKGGRTLESLLT